LEQEFYNTLSHPIISQASTWKLLIKIHLPTMFQCIKEMQMTPLVSDVWFRYCRLEKPIKTISGESKLNDRVCSNGQFGS
jgi:hypothetical protein